MECGSDLKQIRQDFLSFLEIDRTKIDVYTRKNLLKGILNNFFDYLENSSTEEPHDVEIEERIALKL